MTATPGGTRSPFGQLLYDFRERAEFTQAQLAELAGISVDAVRKYEAREDESGARERRYPHPDQMEKLARALKLDDDEKRTLQEAGRRPARRKRVAQPAAAVVSTTAQRGNLPSPAHLIDRDDMLEALTQRIRAVRLVTLVGPGGVGKTSVALEVGVALRPLFPDGIWVVDMTPLDDESRVAGEVARVLGVRPSEDRSMEEALTTALRTSKILFVWDNCERVVSAVAALAHTILQNCPHVRIVVTSLEALSIPGEAVFPVAPLACPAASEKLDAKRALDFGAVALFVERARAVYPEFELSDDNAEIVAQICRDVDGLPLCIEIAAAHAKALGLANLARRPDKRLLALTSANRAFVPHHQRIRALIDWSYGLLDEEERTLLQRVAIFTGGWTLTAAESVCADPPLDPGNVADVLARLVHKSQIVAEPGREESRYRLLQTIREYALERLDASHERPALEKRHALWAADFADRMSDAAWTDPRKRWMAMMTPESDNARAALAWALGHGDAPDLAARIAIGFAAYGSEIGFFGEARRHAEAALDRLRDGHDDLTGRLLLALTALTSGSRRMAFARQAIAQFKRLADPRRLATGYLNLSIAYRQVQQYGRAEVAIGRALSLFQKSGQTRSLYYASALGWRATALVALDRFEESRSLFERDIALCEALGDQDRAAVERLNFAEQKLAAGDAAQALADIEAAVHVLRSPEGAGGYANDRYLAPAFLNAAACWIVLGNMNRAREAAREALVFARRVQYPEYIAVAVQHLATVAAVNDDAERAAKLLGFVEKTFESAAMRREPTERRTYELLLAALQQKLRDSDVARLALEGTYLDEGQAVALALPPV